MYEISIRNMETGETTQAKTKWITAQWCEGENVAAVSLGNGDGYDAFKRCRVMEQEMQRMLNENIELKILWELREKIIQEETVLDLGKIEKQMGK